MFKIKNFKKLLLTVTLPLLASCGSDNSSSPDEDISIEMVEINGLMWATKNLDRNVEGSRCYDDDSINCQKYGRLYTFAQAMGVDQKYDSTELKDITYPYQGICPKGTYLPSHEQWKNLVNYLKSNPEYKEYFTNQVGGAFDYKGYYRSIEEETVFWSSTQYDDSAFPEREAWVWKYAWVWAFRDDNERSIVTDNAHKVTGGYVRCVKDVK